MSLQRKCYRPRRKMPRNRGKRGQAVKDRLSVCCVLISKRSRATPTTWQISRVPEHFLGAVIFVAVNLAPAGSPSTAGFAHRPSPRFRLQPMQKPERIQHSPSRSGILTVPRLDSRPHCSVISARALLVLTYCVRSNLLCGELITASLTASHSSYTIASSHSGSSYTP